MDQQKTQNIKILLFIIISATILLLFFDVVLIPETRNSSDKVYRAENGVLDLRGWDMTEIPYISLHGEWEFFWNQLLDPEDLPQNGTIYSEVPGTWSESSTGYATYRLHVLSDPLKGTFALRNLTAGTAMNIFVDGKQVVAIGCVSHNQDKAVPAYRTGVTLLKDLEHVTSFDIVLQVSNYDYRIGGPWRQIWFGDYETLSQMHWTARVRTIVLFSALLVMGFYHMAIYLLRSKDRQYLALSILCLLLSLRALLPTQFTILDLFPHLSFPLLVRLEYLTFYLALPTSALLFFALYQQEFHVIGVRLILTIAFLFALSVIVTPPLVFTRYIFFFYGFSALSILYIFIVILRAVIHRRTGAVFTVIGTVILAAATINDNFYSSFLIHSNTYIETGMILFIFFQALALSVRMTEAFQEVEILSSSLTELNAGLEQEVDTRAEELKAAYESVRKLELVRFADEERKQLGRDLHDGLGQSVHALELLGEGLRLCRHDPAVTEQKIEAILEVNGEIRDYLYTILEELYPVNIGTLGLVAGIETLAEKISSYHGISVRLDCPQGEVPVNDVLANDLYLIISEAVYNALRHADPSSIQLVLQYEEKSISVHVVNDGVDTHTSGKNERTPQGGRGLKIMEYRTVSHGGVFSAQYEPSGSFSVSSEIPLGQDGKGEGGAMITVMMLDDHQMVREGMKFVLESSGMIKVIGSVGTVQKLKQILSQSEPDVLILDMVLEGVMSGFDLIEYVKNAYPQVKILVITMLVEKQYSDRAFELGALGFLPKREAVSDLIRAVETVAKGKYYISPDTAGQMIHRMVYTKNLFTDDLSVLTPREREIFMELGCGDSNQEIAEKLSISVSTVSTHLENIKLKLNIKTTREISRKARAYYKAT